MKLSSATVGVKVLLMSAATGKMSASTGRNVRYPVGTPLIPIRILGSSVVCLPAVKSNWLFAFYRFSRDLDVLGASQYSGPESLKIRK